MRLCLIRVLRAGNQIKMFTNSTQHLASHRRRRKNAELQAER